MTVSWRGRSIDKLGAAELRIALEDAMDEILRARHAYGSDQVVLTLVAGFALGAATACAILIGLPILR